jgi:dethiobiotin synthetase
MIQQWADAAMIESFARVPVLGVLPHLADPTDKIALAQAAAQLNLEQLIPLPFAIA